MQNWLARPESFGVESRTESISASSHILVPSPPPPVGPRRLPIWRGLLGIPGLRHGQLQEVSRRGPRVGRLLRTRCPDCFHPAFQLFGGVRSAAFLNCVRQLCPRERGRGEREREREKRLVTRRMATNTDESRAWCVFTSGAKSENRVRCRAGYRKLLYTTHCETLAKIRFYFLHPWH